MSPIDPVRPMNSDATATSVGPAPARWHLMLDLETLGKAPDSVVLQIGAILFSAQVESEGWMSYGSTLEIGSQIAAGRTVDPDTHRFWLGEIAKNKRCEAIFCGSVSHAAITGGFIRHCEAWDSQWGITSVWCKGTDFDLPILRHLIAHCGIAGLAEPWPHHAVRDFRTLAAVLDPKKQLCQPQQNKHFADADALHQAQWLCRIADDYPAFSIL